MPEIRSRFKKNTGVPLYLALRDLVLLSLRLWQRNTDMTRYG